MLLPSLALRACFLSASRLVFVVAFDDAPAVTSVGLEGFKLALAFLRTFLKFRRVCCLPTAALSRLLVVEDIYSRVANWCWWFGTTDGGLCAPPTHLMTKGFNNELECIGGDTKKVLGAIDKRA